MPTTPTPHVKTKSYHKNDYTTIYQWCSKYQKGQVKVRVQVLKSQVQIQVPEMQVRVQVWVQVIELQVQVLKI